MTCAWCHQLCRGEAYVLERPYVLIKLDGSRHQRVHTLLMCAACAERLPDAT